MKMTDKDAIRLLSGESGSDVDGAFALAISALRERIERGNQKPLTLDELREMGGEPVYVVWPDGRIKNGWMIVGSTIWIDLFWDDLHDERSDYGFAWVAYRYKPKEAQQ